MIKFPDLDELDSSAADGVNQAATPFANLGSAGRGLALELECYQGRDDVVVLGIALGGIPVAHEVATSLGVPLDLAIIRRLLAPEGPGSQICAVNLGGTMVLDEELPPLAAVPSTPLEHFLRNAIAELTRREQTCRRGRAPINLSGRTIILVDCGIRTGSTMQATIAALRTRKPARIVAAVPVASLGGHAAITRLADELVCLARPRPFGHVGLWYKDFSRPGDDQVGGVFETVPPAG
jgi:putative phosphoribosyl transferase